MVLICTYEKGLVLVEYCGYDKVWRVLNQISTPYHTQFLSLWIVNLDSLCLKFDTATISLDDQAAVAHSPAVGEESKLSYWTKSQRLIGYNWVGGWSSHNKLPELNSMATIKHPISYLGVEGV